MIVNTRHIDIIPTAGLCNRMRAIASAVYISKKLDCPLHIIWNQYEGLHARFDDLFQDIPAEIATLEENYNWKFAINYTKDYLIRRPFLCKYSQVIYNLSIYAGGDIFKKIKNNAKSLLLISCYPMSDLYEPNSLFVPKAEIQEMINLATQQFTTHTIGVHIRRTDNTLSIEDSPIEGFVNILKKEVNDDPDVSFYLASDDKEVKTYMRQKFPNRILIGDNVVSRNSLEGMKFAVAELFTLSKTNKIIGSNYSSYSQIAAELGKIPLEYARRDN